VRRLRDSFLVRYGLAIGLVFLAELLLKELPPEWAPPHWAALFGPAVLLSAWFGGFGPGFVTTLGSVAMVSLLAMDVRLSLRMGEWVDLLVLVVFVVLGFAVSILAGTSRQDSV